MNQNTSGAVLVLILAAAGFATNQPAMWGLAAMTAALAFIKAELDLAHVLFQFPELQAAAVAATLASWAAALTAALILIV